MNQAGGVKATASKNLTRAFVEQMLEAIIDEETRARIREYNKVVNEEDIHDVHITRVVCECARVLYLRTGKFTVPRAKAQLLAEDRAGELYRLLFIAFFRRFNLAYLASYGPEAKSMQNCVTYTIYRLGVVARDWRTAQNLSEELLLPAVRDAVESEITNQYWTLEETLHSRIITPLIDWGLLEGCYGPDDKIQVSCLNSIRVAPLFDRFLQFKGEFAQREFS